MTLTYKSVKVSGEGEQSPMLDRRRWLACQLTRVVRKNDDGRLPGLLRQGRRVERWREADHRGHIEGAVPCLDKADRQQPVDQGAAPAWRAGRDPRVSGGVRQLLPCRWLRVLLL